MATRRDYGWRQGVKWLNRSSPYAVPSMSPREFNAIIEAIGWTRPDLRYAFGVSERSATEYSAGRQPVPVMLAELLRVTYRGERPPEGWTTPHAETDDGR